MSIKLRAEILEKLQQCTPEQQHIFKRMYANRRLDLPIKNVVENMFKDNLMTALSQVERTLINNGKKPTLAPEPTETISITQKIKTIMNITDDVSTSVTRDLFEVLEKAKDQGIKAFRVNEGQDIWPTLAQRKELTEKGYKVEYGQYQTDNQETGFFCMVFFFPPKINPAKTKTLSVDIEVEYTSASFKEKELKKSLTETFNTWGLSGYQILSLTDL